MLGDHPTERCADHPGAPPSENRTQSRRVVGIVGHGRFMVTERRLAQTALVIVQTQKVPVETVQVRGAETKVAATA